MRYPMPPFRNTGVRKFNLDPMLVDGTLDFSVNESRQRPNKKALNR